MKTNSLGREELAKERDRLWIRLEGEAVYLMVRNTQWEHVHLFHVPVLLLLSCVTKGKSICYSDSVSSPAKCDYD